MKALKNYEQLYERLYGTPEKKGAGRAPPHSAFKNNDDDWVGSVVNIHACIFDFLRFSLDFSKYLRFSVMRILKFKF